MKRAVLIFAISLLILSSCATPETITIQQTITKTTTPVKTTQPPRIYELKMSGVKGEPNSLVFYVSVGDRVEGYVAPSHSSALCSIQDLFGGVMVESARVPIGHIVEGGYDKNGFYTPDEISYSTQSAQIYPWNFAYFNAKAGYYSFKAISGRSSIQLALYAKITVYPAD